MTCAPNSVTGAAGARAAFLAAQSIPVVEAAAERRAPPHALVAVATAGRSLAELPDDCWECVYRFLNAVEHVALGATSTRLLRLMKFPRSWPAVLLYGRATDAVLRLLFTTWQLRPESIVLAESGVTDEGLAALSDCTSLTDIDLTRCVNISDAGVAHLAALPRLRALNLFCCRRVTDASLASLANTPLQTLSLVSCSLVTDRGLAHLRAAPLKSLNVSGCSITDEGMITLQGFSQLSVLNLSRCPISDTGLSHLVGLRLSCLHLVATNISSAGLAHVRRLPLKKLFLNNCRKLSERSISRRLAGLSLELVVLPDGRRQHLPFTPVEAETEPEVPHGKDVLFALLDARLEL